MALFTLILEDDDGHVLEALQFRMNKPLGHVFKVTPDGKIIDEGTTCHF